MALSSDDQDRPGRCVDLGAQLSAWSAERNATPPPVPPLPVVTVGPAIVVERPANGYADTMKLHFDATFRR